MAKSKQTQKKSKSAKNTAKPKGLYPYTLQPVALQMTDAEFHQAQKSLFQQSAQNFGLKSIKAKEWIIMAITVALAVAGLMFVKGYSTILFWIMLVGVVLYIVLRTAGMKWYMQREFDKQLAETEIPEEIENMKLGVQKNGLVMSMPAPNSAQQGANHVSRGKGRKSTMQMKVPSHQQAVIPWSDVTSWDETDDFMFIMFELKGQRGSQIIPKRIKGQFPIDSVRKHLLEVKEKGLEAEIAKS